MRLLLFLIIPFMLIMIVPQSYSQTSEQTMFVTSPNYELDGMFGNFTIIQVMISDPNISSVDDPLGYPGVTVNGEDLLMAQGSNGSWYGYFVAKTAAQQADATVITPGSGTDFGEFCQQESDFVSNWYYSEFDFASPTNMENGANGLESPANCSDISNLAYFINNVTTSFPILNNHPVTGFGQINMNGHLWPHWFN